MYNDVLISSVSVQYLPSFNISIYLSSTYSGSADGGSDSRLKRKESTESTADNKSCKKFKQFDKKYLCNQCDYAATAAKNLKRHKESLHEGIRYSCDQCDYAATTTSHLKNIKNPNMKVSDILVINVSLQQQGYHL